MDLLVSTDRLAAEIRSGVVTVVDATYFLPGEGRDAAAEYAAGHIPGALFLDLATLADPDDPRPNMLPSEDLFAARLSALGLGDARRIVLYDAAPYPTAPRAWWMFRLFGLAGVAILDGGFGKWRAEGRAIDGFAPAPASAPVTVRRDGVTLRSKAEVATALREGVQLLDARSAARFAGTAPEPRADIAPGHMPGARNLPSSDLFAADGRWKRGDALRAAFTGAGIDLGRPIITTCGSGVTAAALLFAAALLGKDDVALYDGSWSEWGADPAMPKVIGPA